MNADPTDFIKGEHAVLFYRADDELADRIATYLKGGLGPDGVAIAIATESHLQAIGQKLGAIGVDPQRAVGEGRLILLDARATLAKLFIEGKLDRRAFDREVGGTVRAAGERQSVIRAYGEMVDLLWQDGDILGAIELERLWNELMGELQFTLLCAYHSAALAAPEHRDALRAVCELHSYVSWPPRAAPLAVRAAGKAHEASREFQPEDSAPRAARRFVEDTLRRWDRDASTVDDARLLISELVTNAVTHTRSPFSVSITYEAPKLRLAVHDASPAALNTDGRSDAPSGGRGLRIVEGVADAWGVMRAPPGKIVWAELSER